MSTVIFIVNDSFSILCYANWATNIVTTHLTLKELLISDQLFLILYKELYYRHVYARVQVSERKKNHWLSISNAWTGKRSLYTWKFHALQMFQQLLQFFLDFQGGPQLEQRFESYYNYCNLFNYILSEWFFKLYFQTSWGIEPLNITAASADTWFCFLFLAFSNH